MKIFHYAQIESLLLAVALGICPGFITPAAAQQHVYIFDTNNDRITDLGTFGDDEGTASGINDSGQVTYTTGAGPYNRNAYITGPNGVGMTHLGTVGGDFIYIGIANGLNNAGQVVGSIDSSPSIRGDGVSHAFITGPNGVGMTDLGTLGGKYSSMAYGINETGQVVGESYTAAGEEHAFITGPNGVGMRDLGALDATGINDAGQVVGWSSHAFITGPNGVGMTDLGTLGGKYSSAYGINETGQVVGDSYTAAGMEHAFITGPNGMGMTDLGTLDGRSSHANGINDAGQVVGDIQLDSGTKAFPTYHAFITGPNGVGMIDLNSLVSLPGGIILTEAVGINNHGQVVVVGAPPPVFGVPEPKTYAMLLAGFALVGFMARFRKAASTEPC
jgi:probable HAF family extracellular repeat protein